MECLGISRHQAFPDLIIHAIDVSEAALSTAGSRRQFPTGRGYDRIPVGRKVMVTMSSLQMQLRINAKKGYQPPPLRREVRGAEDRHPAMKLTEHDPGTILRNLPSGDMVHGDWCASEPEGTGRRSQ